jgi:protein XagA
MKKFYFLAIAAYLLTINLAFAGWPMGKKRFMLGTSVSAFYAKDYWDRYGNFQRGTRTFESYTLGTFGSYGLSRRLDFMFSLPLALQINNYAASNKSSGGVGDAQLGLSYNLFNFDYKNYISIYGGAIIPLYSNYNEQTLGLGQLGTDVRIMNTGNLAVEDKKAYYNVELGYRQFYGTNAPSQFTYTAGLGYSIDKENQITADVSGVNSYSPDKATIIYAGAAREFRYVRGSVGYGHVFSRRISLYASGFYTLHAYNTGLGYGASLQAIIRL